MMHSFETPKLPDNSGEGNNFTFVFILLLITAAGIFIYLDKKEQERY